MADIAQLGIAVDTSQTKLAARELENLAAAGAKAEGSTKKLGSTSKQAMEQAAAATAKAQQTMERMLAAQERQEKLMEQMAREMQQLTQALQGNASANNAAAQAAQNAAQALGQESAAAKSAQAAAQGHAQAATSAAAASGAMGAQATATGGALGGMASKVLATATAVLSLVKIISEMDAWTNMNNRIRLVTEGQEQFATAQANIINIAKSTNQPLAETAELYQRLAMNQKTLGLSGTELSGIVKTISQTMVISGSSAAGGAAALMQLGQAFNSGVLRGEEFNSVMEQAPGLMQAIAAGMGKTVGEMRALAEAGKITTDELVKALQKQAATVDTDYGKMSKTVEQSMTNVKTSFTEFVGRADEATGVSKALSTAINGVAANIGPLATIAATLVGVGLATWIGSAAAASGGLAVALSGVAAASTGLLAAMGPAGWLILGVGAAATAWQLLGSKASTAGAQMSSAGEQAAAAGNKLVAGIVPAINTAIGAYDKMIAKQKESMGIAKTPIDDAAKALKEADLNLQKLAQQVARAQQGGGEYVNMGPKQRAAAEKALTDELEKASKKRGELAAKEAEYNSNVVAQYVKGKERQTDASAKLLAIEEAKEKRDKALAAAGSDRARQEQVNSAYRVELAKIEESSAKKAASAVSSATRETNKALKEQNNAYADLAGVSSTYYKELESYQAQRAKGNITEAQYIELVEKLIQKQPFAVELTKKQTEAFKEQDDARKKASAEIEKAYQKEVDVSQKNAESAWQKLSQVEMEIEAMALAKEKNIDLAEAMEEVIVKRLEDQLQAEKQAGNQELLDAIADEIKARKELGKAVGERESIEAADKSAKDAAKKWKNASEEISKDIADAIIAGFEGGKNGAQALKDSLVKMFKDMVLRPVISAIVAPVSGMLATGAQAATSAIGGSGFGGSIVSSLAGNVLGSLGAVGGAISGFGTAALAATQSLIGMTGTAAQMATSLAAAGHTAAAGMQAGANAFAAIPGWGWVVGGIALLASLGIGDTPGEQHQGGIYSSSGKTDMDTAMRVTGGGGWDDGAWARDLTERADAAIGSSLEKVGTGLIDIFEQVNALAGGVADEFELTLGFAANINGEGKDKNAFGYFDLISKATGEVLKSYQNRELGEDTGAAMTKLTNDAASAMLDALAKADVPKWAQNALKALEATPGLQAMQEFLEYPKKLADSFGIAQESMAGAIAEGFKTGDGEAAGQALAQTVLSGIQNSIIGAASQQISTLVTNVILTPILDALANAQDPAAALAAIDFDAVIAKAEGIGEGLAEALNNPALQAAMGKIDATLQQVGQSAVDAAGNLQLIADTAGNVANTPVPTPSPAQTVAQGNPYSMDTARNAYDLQPVKAVSALVTQTLESNKKVSELLQDLLKPKKEYENRYLELDANLATKRQENNLPDWYSKLPALENELAAMLKELDALMSNPEAQDWQISSLTMQARDLMDFINQGKKDAARLEVELREWYLAQSRLIASEDSVQLADEMRDAQKQTAELLRTGGLKDPVTQLQESFAQKFDAINNGINKALQDEIDRLAENSAEGKALLAKIEGSDNWWTDTSLFSAEEMARGREIFGENFAKLLPSSGQQTGDPLQAYKDVIAQLQSDMDDLTEEQQTYLHNLNDWYKAQAELLSTQMLVDINNQIKALEAEEKGPLTTIKDAIQKYADDFEELGTLTADVQAQLDKLAGLQLDQARTSLYDQLLSQEERRAKEQEKLNAAFTELGATTPASTDSLRAMIDAARDAGNVGLADSLLELIPAFIALQGAAEGVGGGGPIGAANDAYAALEKAVAAEQRSIQKSFDSRMEAIQKEREELQEAHSKRMEELQDELKSAQERAALEKTALGLLGRSAELREQELESIDASNRALQQRVWALQDANAAVDKSLATLQRSIAAEKERITEQAQAEIDAITDGADARQKAIEDAQKSAQELTEVFEEITNAVKTLRGNAQDEAVRMEQARAYISMALSVTRAGGSVDRERLSGAIATVTSDTAEGYITSADYRFAQARQAAELQALADITGEQKDVAQETLDAAIAANETAQKQITAINESRDAQLRALDKQLKEAQDAVSVMRGVDLSVIAVGDALTALDASILAYEETRADLAAENLNVGRSNVALLELQIQHQQDQFKEQMDALEKQEEKARERFERQMASLDAQLAAAKEQIDALNGIDNSVLSVEDALAALAKALEEANDAPVISGVYGREVSTPYTPATVPRSFNSASFGGVKTDDAQLASLVVSLTTEVQRLQTIVKAGNDEQRRTADAVNGRPEAPMLVETV